VSDERTARPLPLDMPDRDVERVMTYIDTLQNEQFDQQRLLIEILDCLRRIDNKLARILEHTEH
jgi:hypothetical protein